MRKIDKLLKNPDVFSPVVPETGEPGNVVVQFQVMVKYTHVIPRERLDTGILPRDEVMADGIAHAREKMILAVEDLFNEEPEVPEYKSAKS